MNVKASKDLYKKKSKIKKKELKNKNKLKKKMVHSSEVVVKQQRKSFFEESESSQMSDLEDYISDNINGSEHDMDADDDLDSIDSSSNEPSQNYHSLKKVFNKKYGKGLNRRRKKAAL